MKKNTIACLLSVLFAGVSLAGCQNEDPNQISVAASELPHAKILDECIKGILEEKGYSLKVTVLDWTLQNDAVANDEYDANYFQHVPYLKTYAGDVDLYAACKVHYEKLCLYASNAEAKTINKDSTIELVNDISNVERALKLLESNSILSIKEDCYENGSFVNFDPESPNDAVEFSPSYSGVKLTCVKESQLCQSLADYDFGVIPGNTALTGLGSSFSERIVFSEEASEEMLSQKANIIAVKKENKDNAKTKALVEAFSDERVSSYISSTFGDSVIYHYENGLGVDWLA